MQRWVELIDIAREDITRAIHTVDINVGTMDEIIHKYEGYPPDVQILMSKLKEKLADFLANGATECNAAASMTDFGRIVAMIDKYDSSSGPDEEKTYHLMYLLRPMCILPYRRPQFTPCPDLGLIFPLYIPCS